MPQRIGEERDRSSSRPRAVPQWGRSSKPDQESIITKKITNIKNKVSEMKKHQQNGILLMQKEPEAR